MLSVKQYQKNLHHYYAYYNGNIDGICGAQTKAAVKRFQKGHGLTQDGIYGANTNARLVAQIKKLQQIVGTTQDGIVGSKTIAGIKAKQKTWGITQDGIAGTSSGRELTAAVLLPVQLLVAVVQLTSKNRSLSVPVVVDIVTDIRQEIHRLNCLIFWRKSELITVSPLLLPLARGARQEMHR